MIITSSLAAGITGVLSLVGISRTQAREQDTQRCQIAAQLLQDETPTPYIDAAGQRRLASVAAHTLVQCLEKR